MKMFAEFDNGMEPLCVNTQMEADVLDGEDEEEDDSEVMELLNRIRARGEQKQPEPVKQQPVQVEKTPRTQKEQLGLLFSW